VVFLVDVVDLVDVVVGVEVVFFAVVVVAGALYAAAVVVEELLGQRWRGSGSPSCDCTTQRVARTEALEAINAKATVVNFMFTQ